MGCLTMRKGVSGILRVKNDAVFIERCVVSCIDALDELVIVFNDCTDNSEAEIERMRLKYPDKIKVYEYPYKVYGANLTREEYEKAKQLPEDSPNLLCNYYNFALSKVTCEYALKIDADQIYFTEELRGWCEWCRNISPMKFGWKSWVGRLFQSYLSFFRFMSMRLKRVVPVMPQWLVEKCYPYYMEYAKYLFSHDRACLSMSGINVLEGKETCVSLGFQSDIVNILPPFNGEGDHVIFKVKESAYYRKFDMAYYNDSRSSAYSLIEEFVHPYRIMFIGFFWIHISSMRSNIKDLVIKVKEMRPEAFVSLHDFVGMSYKDILKRTDRIMFSLFQRILFSFVYKAHKRKLSSL